jgi:cyclopropane fatty-acyl-phospholipid synthase-like methyltransferase
MLELTEADKQVLIALAELAARGWPGDGDRLEALARDYFGAYLVTWGSAYSRLVRRGILEQCPNGYRIAPAWQPLGDLLRAENPRYLYFYDEFFARARDSRAHAEFCEQVYGRNLCQHGMMDMSQLDMLLDVLDLDKGQRVLELGCGNGMVAEIISDRTRAHMVGIDTSAVGIRQAAERTRRKRARLSFLQADMRALPFAAGAFAAAIAIDSAYYAGHLEQWIGWLREVVRAGGHMAVFFSAWIGADQPPEGLLPDQNRLAQALKAHGLRYRTWDFTASEIQHWQRKLQLATDLRTAFEAEGNAFLYRKRWIEAEYHRPYVETGRVSRYLYDVEF